MIQIDAPRFVSSFLQRMGRTGRRAGSTANCTFLATDDDALLRAAAIIDLFRRGYIEPAAPSVWAPHVLAHQAIALAMQEQGSAVHDWWKWLEGCAAFSKVSASGGRASSGTWSTTTSSSRLMRASHSAREVRSSTGRRTSWSSTLCSRRHAFCV
ncbi:MAG: hypothetical protein IPJ34_43300 [Myxococcales bacterium]|nr:hypothetical protein [Myxococcales bacterium]